MNVQLLACYTGNYTYEQTQSGEVLKYFRHPEGYVQPDGSGGYDYIYQYKDHLGNIRLSYSDTDADGIITPSEIIEENNYYPFGLKHKGYNNVVNGEEYPYRYNGKEWQDELGLDWYDLGARVYDPAGVQFGSIDPKAEEYYFQSPYVFSADNPVFFVDINGMGVDENEDDYGIDKNGNIKLIKKTDDNFDRLYEAVSDENGNAVLDENGNAIKKINGEGNENVDYVKVNKPTPESSSIISDLAESHDYSQYNNGKHDHSDESFATTTNTPDANKVFQFAADNSDVEWALVRFDGGNNLIQTSHGKDNVLNYAKLGLGNKYSKNRMWEHNHSHPYNNFASKLDVVGAGKYTGRTPRFFIYYPKEKTRTKYTKYYNGRSNEHVPIKWY